VKIGSGIQKFLRGNTHTNTQTASLLLFFQNRENRLRMVVMQIFSLGLCLMAITNKSLKAGV
jgi:hypothetical protein